MKKKRKAYKKIICLVIAFALIIGTVSVDLFNHAAVAQAKSSTFHGMAPYQDTGKNGLSVLEITPTANDKDFGYFVNPDPNRDQINNVAELTYGNLLAPVTNDPDLDAQLALFRQIKANEEAPARTEAVEAAKNDEGLKQKYEAYKAANTWYTESFETYIGLNGWGPGQGEYDAVVQQKYNSILADKISAACQAQGLDYDELAEAEAIAENPDMYYAVILRSYGMIKYAGADAVEVNGDSKRNALSEYPIFSDSSYPLFASADIEGNYMIVPVVSGTMVSGHYVLNTNNTGAYQLKEGYVLGDNSQPTDAVDDAGTEISIVLEDGYIYRKDLYVDPDGNGNGNGKDKDTESGTDKVTDAVSDNSVTDANVADAVQQSDVQGQAEEPDSETAVSAPDDVQPDTASTGNTAGDAADNAKVADMATADGSNTAAGTGNAADVDEVTDDANTVEGDADADSTPKYIYTKITNTNGLPEGVLSVASGGNLDFSWLANVTNDKYSGYSTEKLYFTRNGDKKYRLGAWIKEYILGDATKNYTVSYTNATIDQINSGNYNLDDYDLIYISGKAEEYVAVNGDLSAELVKQIYNASAINHKAVMMDYALYDAENGAANINNLALLLWQNDQKAIVEGNESYFSYDLDDELTGIDDITGLLRNTAIMNSLQGTLLSGYGGNFAVNNVYVYNHRWSDFQNSKLERFQNDALDVFANGDLNSQYTAAATAGGFQSVLAYISYNNTLSVDDGNGNMTEGYVTPAIAIQYILSYMGEDLSLTKGKFVILEIEPTKQFRFNSEMETKDYTLETAEVKAARDEFITKCLGTDIVEKGMQDYVSFTSVTIDQYNTMQTDLIHDYDIVYIGDEYTQYFYTRDELDTAVAKEATGTAGTTDTTTGTDAAGNSTGIVYNFETEKGMITAFNTDSMYGNVYYNYGDDVNPQAAKTAQRYGSRDLTEAKLTELKNYLLNRGLIVVDEDLMRSKQQGNTVINPTEAVASDNVYHDHGRIDTSSNMYELFNFAQGRSFDGTQAKGNRYQAGGVDENNNPVGTYSNFVSMGDLGVFVDREDLLIYLNRERLSLNLTKQPTAYIYSAGQTPSFIQADSKDGKYYLECEFVIDNSTAIIAAEDVYQIHFYQDVNADGRFADTEEKVDFEIIRSADDAAMPLVTSADGTTQYNLNNGVAYKLRRAIPSDEGGIINWCIKAEKISNKDINCTASGFTAVKPRTVKYLNILQIIPDGEAATINLEEILKEQKSELYDLLTDEVVKQNYEIAVRTVTASQFQRDTMKFYTDNEATLKGDALWQKYFSTFQRTNTDIYGSDVVETDKDKPMNVNMIILGFGTSEPRFTNTHPTLAIKYFLDSNRPVLAGNSWINQDYMDHMSGQDVELRYNYNFLSYFGQDRYGYTNALYSGFYNKNTSLSRLETEGEDDAEKQTIKDVVSTYITPRENDRLAVAYIAGGERGNAYVIPYAYTNTVLAKRTRTDTSAYTFINAGPVNALTTGNDPTAAASNTLVDRMNDGQVSYYPYTISDGSGALVSKTQAQSFQLDLDRDSDGDGNSDIVVWYTLGDMANGAGSVVPGAGIYSATPGDGINNYYIYNYGNATFTGFGGSSEGNCTTEEKKLFVNTLIAAYEAGLINPTVSYYQTKDSNSSMLESIAVPYDKNVVLDSSVQLNETGDDYLYKFVNPNTDASTAVDGTKAFFKVQDSNFVRGDKSCHVYFYLGVPNSSDGKYRWPNSNQVSDIIPLQLNDNSVVYVVKIPVVIYDAENFSQVGVSDPNNLNINPKLEVGKMYGFYAPMAYLSGRGSAEIYIQADTSYTTVSGTTGEWVDRPLGTAYDMFTLIKQDLLKLD